jgi:hypothetical protein
MSGGVGLPLGVALGLQQNRHQLLANSHGIDVDFDANT